MKKLTKGNETGKFTNKSPAVVQAKRLDNYSEAILEGLDILEPYSEEIESVINVYNRKSTETTMALRLARNSSHRIQNRRNHQDMVGELAVLAAKKIGLNVGMTRIIARNHDIRHMFYGHGGEWWLSDIKKEYGLGCYVHNALGPKELVYREGIEDEIINRIQTLNPEMSEKELKRIKRSLWLIFDAILSHNGELSETEYKPNLSKTKSDYEEEIMRCHIEEGFDRTIMPATTVGCLIRIFDKIAYTAFDMLDGLHEGMIEELDEDYISVLTELGIPREEIEEANIRHSYDKLARDLQIIFTKSVIENSSKTAIRMDQKVAKAMHEIRDLNNKKIIDLEVLQEDQDIIPDAVNTLINRFADIIEMDTDLVELRTANTNIEIAKRLMEKYRGTPHEDFITFITSTTPEIYDFNSEMIRRAAEVSNKGQDISYERKMALEFGAEYMSTLNDPQFLNLLYAQELLTDEQRSSLTRTYKSIGREGLEKEMYRPNQWAHIENKQKEATIAMGENSGEIIEEDDEFSL